LSLHKLETPCLTTFEGILMKYGAMNLPTKPIVDEIKAHQKK
jgi:hypothetical protein